MDAPKSLTKEKQFEIFFNKNIYNCILRLNDNQMKIKIEILSNNIKYIGEKSIYEIKLENSNFIGLNNDEFFEELCDAKSFKLKKKNKLIFEIIVIMFRKEMYIDIELEEIINNKNNGINNNNKIENKKLVKEKDEIIYKNLIVKLKDMIKMKNERIKLLQKELNKINENNINNDNIKNEENLYKNFNINLKNPLCTLDNHQDYIYCLTLLNDGRFASGSRDNTIIIYNLEIYLPDIIIKEHNDYISCLIQLKNGNLASSSGDKTIKLFDIKENEYKIIQILNIHSNYVNKIIELYNNYLVSCSDDLTIIFYNKNNSIYKKDFSISVSKSISNIIQTKQNEIVYSTEDKKINFYDIKERKIKSIIENINFNTEGIRTWFCIIKKYLLLIPGYEMISIINVNEYKKIREINIPCSKWIYGICILNSNMIITGDYNKGLKQWKIEGDNLILFSRKEMAHFSYINVILNLGNGHIATGSNDYTIKIW